MTSAAVVVPSDQPQDLPVTSTSTATRLSSLLQEAIQSLQAQDYSKATRLLVSGTEILDRYDCPQVFDEEEEEDQMMCMSDPYGEMNITMIPLRDLPEDEEEDNTNTDESMLVFRQAFYMEVRNGSEQWDLISEDQHDAFGCLFLYNLGLSRHFASMKMMKKNQDSLVKMQHQALQDYRGAGGWLHGVPGKACQWVTLALANNSCLIECQFEELRREGYESLETIHEQLQTLMVLMRLEERTNSKSSGFLLFQSVACNYLFFRNALAVTTAPMA